ncbi:MAG: U32 family peptidase [Desulfobulbus sp.]|nr:U32 family peptidase [Desulfobulbus sp.]
MQKRDIELLAPARDLACGLAAIDHGADAVYIGGPLFGARAAAANSLADIEQLVQYAHLFRVRVYVALNTLFREEELAPAVELCFQLNAIGVDALIIQDLGLLEYDLPPIPLHASTQLNNRTPEKVRFLEQVGFSQVVLARELNLEQIRAIRAATTVPLECFVHGALCVSYSGQCYISEIMSGRSANRGECAQFCRHKFDLFDASGKLLAENRYLLSLKDLDLTRHLSDLIDVGVRSFKIEGRLKDSHYVKNVTAAYRQALDAIIDSREDLVRASSGRCRFAFTPDPSRSFSRGATDYFLRGPRAKMAEIRTPKSIGKLVGRVSGMDAKSFAFSGDEVLHNGDGLCFFDQKNSLIGLRVNRVEGHRVFPKDALSKIGLSVGTELYRNSDPAFNGLLEQSQLCRTIGLTVVLSEIVDGLQLEVMDEDGLRSFTTLEVSKEKAKNPGSVEAIAIKQLQKSGGTVFHIEGVKVQLEADLFVPASVFNELRRKALDNHLEQRQKGYILERTALVANDVPWLHSQIDYRDNVSNSKAAAFFQRHGVAQIDPAALRPELAGHCALMTTKYCIRRQLGICVRSRQEREKLAEPLVLADKTGRYLVRFHCDVCEMTITRFVEDGVA